MTDDPASLNAIAAELESLARTYRLKAADRQAMLDAAAEGRRLLDRAYSSWQVLDHLLSTGLPYQAALDAATAQTGLPPETITYHWKRAQKARKNDTAEGRAISAVRLAARGWTNAQIAEELGIHPNSVSRIISKALHRNG